MQNILEVKNLTKIFEDRKARLKGKTLKPAVDNLSFSLKEGEILGILGPNGAGKTTTFQMLLGALTPTSGKILYLGREFKGLEDPILNKINFSSAYTNLPGRMTVWENLNVFADLYGVMNKRERAMKLLQDFDIEDLAHKKVKSLSAGQKTRVLLIKAMINYPKILLLDEPTASLDPEIARKVRNFLLYQQKKHKVSIVFTSHNMHEIQEICDRIIFLNKGKIVAEDTPMGILGKFKETKLRLFIDKGPDRLMRYCQGKKIPISWKKEKATLSLKEKEIPKSLYEISKQGVRYTEIEIVRPTLEDFFIEIAKGQKGVENELV